MLGSRKDIRPPNKPGWYPAGEGRLRYYDGAGWTDDFRQLPNFDSFLSEIPASETSFRHYTPPMRRRSFKLISILAAVLLMGGVVVQLLVITLSQNSLPQLSPAESYSQTANSICKTVFAGPPVSTLVKTNARSVSLKLSQAASAFGVLAGESPKIDFANSIATDWSSLAVAWSVFVKDHSHHQARIVSTKMALLDKEAKRSSLDNCVVFPSRLSAL